MTISEGGKTTCLDVNGLTVAYGGGVPALSEVSFQAHSGQVSLFVGPNGAGKSSLMKALMGEAPVTAGSICLVKNGERRELQGLRPEARARLGLRLVKDAGDELPQLTVRDNLRAGSYLRTDRAGIQEDLDRLLQRFTRLAERLDQPAETLSGGEHRLLKIARALIGRPVVLILDEPSSGLDQAVLQQVLDAAVEVARAGAVVIIADQHAPATEAAADRIFLLEHGKRTDDEDSPVDLEQVALRYLGRQ